MNELDQLIETAKGLSHDQKVLAGRSHMANIEEALAAVGIDEKERSHFILCLISIAVSGDRTTSFEEYALFCAMFGEIVKYEVFFDLTNGGAKKENVAMIDEIVDKLPMSVKADCLGLALLFLTADGEVKESEKALFEKLLA